MFGYVWKVISNICFNSMKEKATITTPYVEKDTSPFAFQSYFVFIFMILIYLCFTYLIYWSIRIYKKRRRKSLAKLKVKKKQTHKEYDCDKLKEVREILRKVNRQLAPPSRIPRFLALHSAGDFRKNALPTRSQLSDVSSLKNAERKPSREEVKQGIQAALHLLEKEIASDKRKTSEIRKYQKTNIPVTKLHIYDDEQLVYEDRWNKEDSTVEMEQRDMEDWTENFENDESILSPRNEINESEVLLNVKENKAMEAYEKFSKHRALSASHSDTFYSYGNYFPGDSSAKQNFPPKNFFSNSSSRLNSERNLSSECLNYNLRSSLEFLNKKIVNDKYVANENVKYPQEDNSDRFNGNDGTFCEFESQKNKTSTKSSRLNSKMNQHMKDGQQNYLENAEFVTLSDINSKGSQNSFHNVMRNKEIEPCTKHRYQKESLSVLHPPADSKEITRRTTKELVSNFPIKSSKKQNSRIDIF